MGYYIFADEIFSYADLFSLEGTMGTDEGSL
jgi:hypothetical protein